MRTLIIPCCGGRKYQGKPIYLLNHPDGTYLIDKAIKGIEAELFDKIVVTFLKSDFRKYNVQEFFNSKIIPTHKNMVLVTLDEQTGGPAQTVYETIKAEKLSGEIIVKDLINTVTIPKIEVKNFITGINLSNWNHDIHNIRTKSFIQLNEQNQVLDIIEKQIHSESISVGLYGFADVNDFLMAYEKLSDSNYNISSLYISHIISYLIGYSSRIFHFITAIEFEEWNDEKNWLELQKKYATYFLDLDNLFEQNQELYINGEVLKSLKEISENGARFVGFTSSDESAKPKVKRLFHEFGINCIQVVYACSMSNIKKILSTSEQIAECLYEI